MTTTTNAQRTTTRSQFRIVVIEGHTLFAEALELALSIEGYDVHAVAVPPSPSGLGALRSSLLRLRPRLVLIDLDLGSSRDGEAVRLVRSLARTGIDVVAVTASPDRGLWGEAVGNGARSVLSTSQPLRSTIATIRQISQGRPVLHHREREELLEAWQRQRSETLETRARMALLSPRESQVLGHLMKGRTVNEIASSAVVSEATVRTQVKSILAKLDVSSQLTAVGMAYQVGWKPPVA